MSDISDSEEEERRSLDLSLIAKQTLQRKLSHLPYGRRRELENTLGKYDPTAPLYVLTEEDEVVEDSDNDAPMEVETVYNKTNPEPLETVPVQMENEENAGHLQAYINSKYSTFVSERSLRKRNFASTHPYLSDQASYLGLADAHELNSVYEQNDRNLEAVVKLLNYNYLKLKSRYPKDEKFKQKSFYAIIGKQSKDAQQEEREKEKKNERLGVNGNDEGFANFEVDPGSPTLEQRLESSQLSDDVAYEVNNYELEADLDSNSESDLSADEEEDKENLYVRVGGRYRKEKNALKGILPESAKHLSIYKTKTSRLTQRAKPPREMRKGFAFKKSGGRSRSFRLHDDLEESFLNDDDIEDVSPGIYVVNSLPELEDENDVLSSPGQQIYLDSELSESSNTTIESDNDSDLFALDTHERDALQDLSDDMGEALENDAIDRMLTTNTHSRVESGQSKSNLNSRSSASKGVFKGGINRIPRTHERSKHQSQKSQIRPRVQKLSSNTMGRLNEPTHMTGRLRYNTIDSFTKSVDHALDMDMTESSYENPEVGHNRKIAQSERRLFRAQLQHKSYTKSNSTGTRKTLKKKKSKNVRNHDLKENYFGPARVATRGRADRAPLLASIDVEAESHDQDYQHLRKRPKIFNHHLNGQLQLSHEPLFAPDCILNYIELTKLSSTGDGKTFHRFQDPITVAFKDRHFNLCLLDIDSSRALVDQLCSLLNSKLLRGAMHKRDFYHCVRGLIAWSLILQRSPSESEWSWVETMIITSRDNAMMKQSDKFFCLPYLVLLQYVMLVMDRINGGVGRKQSITTYAATYWSWFFDMVDDIQFEIFDFHSGSATKQAESFYIMCRLSELQGAWWSSICLSVQNFDRYNLHSVLEGVYYLCCITRKSPTWEPLQMIFQKFSGTTGLELYYRYIEIIFSMNRIRNWQIDEKLILQVYGNITSRRFANLPNEDSVPSILSQVRTRFDIPGNSFFDKFLQLLFWHISSLADVSQVKRLVTKLLSFNSIQYSDAKGQQIMFVNKFNLLIMLCSISKTDLRAQVEILLSSISDVTELSFLKHAVEGISVITEIALSKGTKLSTEGVEIMTNKLASVAFSIHGATKLWKKFLRSLRSHIEQTSVEPSSMIQLLSLIKQIKVELPISINNDVAGLCAAIVEQLIAAKAEINNVSLTRSLHSVKEKSLDIANSYMLKLASDGGSSEKADTLIGHCITIWIVVCHLVNENWDKLVLQTYPFVGEELSRDKFVFHFYMEVSRFYNLNNCKQSVIANIIRGLSSYRTPARLIEFINRLSGLGWGIFSFHKLRSVLESDLTSTKFGILTNMLSCSSSSDSSGELNMMAQDLLRTIKKESCNYSNGTYKDFCTSLVKELNKYELDGRSNTLLTEVSSLLDIEVDPMENELPVLHFTFDDDFEPDERLHVSDVGHSIPTNLDDYYFVLQRLLEIETSDVIIKWKFIHKFLGNFSMAVFQHRFQFSNGHFLGIFDLFLKELDESDVVSEAEVFKIRVFTKICVILREMLRVLFEGYRMPSDFVTMFKEFEYKIVEAYPFVADIENQNYDEGRDPHMKLAMEYRQTFFTNVTTADGVYTEFDLYF
ncbi:hypothetical protein CORT_0A00410 [Candida orthopsilosis Co 90-125]|uniref:Uncharacterized protein n=1 Tax=Candida orthopsilosis (strain 90-125) TaxID=1136231 RepID=H8WVG2_CANO9|nr:hypothetical protein CORT_0A00410 [Candida orthopsilosis Co 90-125]CCG20434.1 hypothetical protein CORT_0A00410 [Candida orthopsilosis Co 90-125]